ncbi:MAG: hypothetical protein ACK4Q5_13290 [Saprospiraceae bacterium]
MKNSIRTVILLAAVALFCPAAEAQRKAETADPKAAIIACAACHKLVHGDPLTDVESMLVKNLGTDFCAANPCDLKTINPGDQLTQPQAALLDAYRQALGSSLAEDEAADTPATSSKPTPSNRPANPSASPDSGDQTGPKTDQQILDLPLSILQNHQKARTHTYNLIKFGLQHHDSECQSIAGWLAEASTGKPLSSGAAAAVQALRDAYEGK